jgi:hypothetical protein
MKNYQWTEADVAEAKRCAALKQVEAQQSVRSAGQIEEEFWESRLVSRFPELEYKTHEIYEAVIAFNDGEQTCLCKGPISSSWLPGSVGMLVWRKGSKGKFHKTAAQYDCGQIVPFIKKVVTRGSLEAVE